MPKLRRYRIFISHAWDFDEYHKIKEFLNSTPNFLYSDYSVPHNNSLIAKNKTQLREALKRLIRLSQIVLVPAGMEVNYREFILFELNFAQDIEKPIVGIAPWGARQIPRIVSRAAWEVVGWNRISIVDAICRNAL